MTAELMLDGRPEAPPRRRRLRHPRLVLAGAVLVLGALFLLDRWLQQREFDQLTDRVATAQGAIDYANAQVAGMIQYGSPQLFMTSTPEGVRTYLRGLVADASTQGAADVADADGAVAGVSILPWHRGLIDARAAFLRHAEDWQAFLRTSLSARGATADLTARMFAGRDEAKSSLLAAAPFGSSGAVADRVAAIFASSP